MLLKQQKQFYGQGILHRFCFQKKKDTCAIFKATLSMSYIAWQRLYEQQEMPKRGRVRVDGQLVMRIL